MQAPSRTTAAHTEVAIIGGGLAGCATAAALTRRGVACRVLEREASLGRYASGRGAGLGRQLAEDDPTTRLTLAGAAGLRGELARVWTPTGGVLSFDDPAHAQAYVERAARFEIAVEILERADVLARWPAMGELEVAAALWIPSDGVIDVRALLDVFAAGATIEYGIAVERVEAHGRGARLTTSRGVIDARIVVDAAGAWAGQSTGAPALASYKRHLFVVDAAPVAGAPYLWHLGARELYVRAEGSATLACPCDETLEPPGDAHPDADGTRRLRALLGTAAPAWRDLAIVRQWACQRSFTPDRQMRLGRDPARPWLVWAAGLGGHGATASPAIGQIVADAVADALADAGAAT